MGDNDFEVGKLVASVENLTKAVDTLQVEVKALNNFKLKLLTISSLISTVIGFTMPFIARLFP